MEDKKRSQICRLVMVEAWKREILMKNHTYLLHKEEIVVLDFFQEFCVLK